MKIAFFGVKSWEESYLTKRLNELLPGLELRLFREIINKDHPPLSVEAETICVFVDSEMKKEMIDLFPNLKHIVARATGYDNIDIGYAKSKGIAVSNVPSYGENTVAEFAFALILTLSRKIFESVERIKETGRFSFDGLQGFDLKGKTIGVVGVGRIGQHAIKIAKGFEMTVIGYDPFPQAGLDEKFGFTYRALEEVLMKSDIITIHVPYNKETHHLFNTETIGQMKTGAILINTSRGGVVDTMALLYALQSGKIGGAGLDVLEEEGVIKEEMDFLIQGAAERHDLKTILANHVLINLPNVIITPHNAFNTKEAVERILETAIQNIAAFQRGAAINAVSMPGADEQNI